MHGLRPSRYWFQVNTICKTKPGDNLYPYSSACSPCRRASPEANAATQDRQPCEKALRLTSSQRRVSDRGRDKDAVANLLWLFSGFDTWSGHMRRTTQPKQSVDHGSSGIQRVSANVSWGLLQPIAGHMTFQSAQHDPVVPARFHFRSHIKIQGASSRYGDGQGALSR